MILLDHEKQLSSFTYLMLLLVVVVGLFDQLRRLLLLPLLGQQLLLQTQELVESLGELLQGEVAVPVHVERVEDGLELVGVEGDLAAHALHVALRHEPCRKQTNRDTGNESRDQSLCAKLTFVLLVADGEEVGGLLGEEALQLVHDLGRDVGEQLVVDRR